MKNKFLWLIMGIMISLNSISLAENAISNSLFQRGLSLYDEGRYNEAIDAFEEILKSDPRRGHVLYNLGNAYYKSGKKGSALGAYYAARRLLPRNPDIRANIGYLESSNEERLASEENQSISRSIFFWLDTFNTKELTFLSSFLLMIVFLIVGVGFLFSHFRKISVVGAIMAGLICIIIFTSLMVKYDTDEVWGAVSIKKSKIFSDRDKGAAVVFELHEGAPVIIVEDEKDWVKVKISDGKQGWVMKSSVKYFNF